MITPEMQADLDALDAALAGTAPAAELTDLGRLALELRAERPEPDPFFTRELDAKAAAGFPRPRPRWRQAFSGTLVPGAVASMLVVVVIGATILGGSGTSDESETGGAGGGSLTAESVEDSDATTGEPAGGGGSTGAGTAASPPAAESKALQRSAARPQTLGATGADEAAPSVPSLAPVPPTGGGSSADRRERRIQETSASLTLTTAPTRINEVADKVVRVTDQLGGFVVSSSVSSTDGDGGGGLFELRVPSAKLQTALAELSKIAHVSQRQQASQDITAESVSARDRLQDARAERVALLRRLARASTTAEIDSLKGRLRIVSARIAAAKADLARVGNRASFSNIAVSLAADPNAGEPGTDDGQWTPGDAARDALRVLEVIAGVALIALAIGIPLALLVTLLLAAARLSARRRRERVLDAV